MCVRGKADETAQVTSFQYALFRFQARKVKNAVNICFDAEYGVKSGRLNQDGVLESVMLKLLNLRAKKP